jgi:hypothetical protein
MTKKDKREAEELKAFNEHIERYNRLEKAKKELNLPTDFALWEELERRLEMWKVYRAMPPHTDNKISRKRAAFETEYFEETGRSLFYDPDEEVAAPILRAEIRGMSDLEFYKYLRGCHSGNEIDGDLLYGLTGWNSEQQEMLSDLYEKWMDGEMAQQEKEDAEEVVS